MYLGWTGLFEFLVSADGHRILYRRLEQATRDSFSVYLLSHVLSFSLLALELEPMHGTVIDLDGEAVAFVGECGYGKSTLGAALLAQGFRVVTDDLIALKTCGARGWAVHPGVPRLKLFPTVARRLLGSRLRGTPMNNTTSKLVLPLTAEQTSRRPVPLKAIYVVTSPAPCAADRSVRLGIEHLSGREAFLEIIRAAFNLVDVGRERLANQFAFATRVATGTLVRRLTYARDLSLLPSVCDAILTDVAGIKSARAH